MQIKRFEAQSMAEAFRMIKAEFGPDAVILSARHVRKDTGLFGVTRTVGVEVTAAIDTTATFNKGRKAVPRPERFVKTPLFWDNGTKEPQAGVISRISKRGRQLSQKIADGPIDRRPPSPPEPVALPDEFSDRVDLLPPAEGAEERWARESRPRRRAIQPNPAVEGIPRRNDEKDLVQAMENHGVDPVLIMELMKEVRRFRTTWPRLMEVPVPEILFKVIEAKGLPDGMTAGEAEGKVHLFVGPAGSGKSSVLSKLVVKAVMEQRNRVGIVSLDDGRMGAIYQLKAFARILNVPVVLASGPEQYKAALEKMRAMDRIFVDTPGVGGKDFQRLEQIEACLDAWAPDHTYLVLSATPPAQDLDRQVRRFRSAGTNALIFTKFDETPRWGGAFSQLIRYRLPIAYVTDGQEIPEDIRRVRLKEIVDQVASSPSGSPAMQPGDDGAMQGRTDRRYVRSGGSM